jgi:hypothetical protein
VDFASATAVCNVNHVLFERQSSGLGFAVHSNASPSPIAWRQHDLHARVDIEGLGHRLVHLIDRKFVGDEFFQRIGFLELVQDTQAARVAGWGMVAHSIEADWFASRCRCGLMGMSQHRRTRPPPARWRGIMPLAEICIPPPCPCHDAVSVWRAWPWWL